LHDKEAKIDKDATIVSEYQSIYLFNQRTESPSYICDARAQPKYSENWHAHMCAQAIKPQHGSPSEKTCRLNRVFCQWLDLQTTLITLDDPHRPKLTTQDVAVKRHPDKNKKKDKVRATRRCFILEQAVCS
jgi:hypothetical protein